jgi:hypothetical protein
MYSPIRWKPSAKTEPNGTQADGSTVVYVYAERGEPQDIFSLTVQFTVDSDGDGVLDDVGVSHREVADAPGVSSAAVSLFLKRDRTRASPQAIPQRATANSNTVI